MIRIATSVLAAALIAPAALATIVGPGGTVTNPAGQVPSFGALLFTTGPVGFSTLTFSGTLTSSVFAGDPQNTLGGLTFHYTVTNDPGSVNAIERLTVNNYDAIWTTDMTWQQTAPGSTPFAATRDPSASPIGFTFANFLGHSVIFPGQSSVTLVVHTNAPNWQPTIASVIDGYTANPQSIAPVPTPGVSALLGIGMLAANRRRRS